MGKDEHSPFPQAVYRRLRNTNTAVTLPGLPREFLKGGGKYLGAVGALIAIQIGYLPYMEEVGGRQPL